MSENLKGKVAVITGSTSGIGLGLAKGLAKSGIHIVMNGFGDEQEIEKERQSIKSCDVKCIYHGADMTKPSEIEDLVKTAKEEMGSIDILVNNAGIQHVSKVEEFPDEKWEKIISINLSSSFYMIKHTIPIMKEQGWGRVINLVSAHGLVASPFKSAYVSAKHGVMGLTKTIALEVAEDNITVNAICPGYVKTPLVDGQIADTAKARGISEEEVVNDVLLKAQHTKKFVEVEHLAELAKFLCSDAASNMTGTHLSVDGGWTAS